MLTTQHLRLLAEERYKKWCENSGTGSVIIGMDIHHSFYLGTYVYTSIKKIELFISNNYLRKQ